MSSITAGVHPYSEFYLHERMLAVAFLFQHVCNDLTGVDTLQFMRDYLASQTCALADAGSPHHLCLGDRGILREMREIEGYCLPAGKTIDHDDFSYWAGMLYTYTQWAYNIPSTAILEIADPTDLYRFYPGMHTRPLQSAAEMVMGFVVEDN